MNKVVCEIEKEFEEKRKSQLQEIIDMERTLTKLRQESFLLDEKIEKLERKLHKRLGINTD
jgi:polyhydroxyalkanoate synthesis regulator phasin